LRGICTLAAHYATVVHAEDAGATAGDAAGDDADEAAAMVKAGAAVAGAGGVAGGAFADTDVHVARELLTTLAHISHPHPSHGMTRPLAVLAALQTGAVSAAFDDRNQHDAHELLCHLLSVLDDDEGSRLRRDVDRFLAAKLHSARLLAVASGGVYGGPGLVGSSPSGGAGGAVSPLQSAAAAATASAAAAAAAAHPGAAYALAAAGRARPSRRSWGAASHGVGGGGWASPQLADSVPALLSPFAADHVDALALRRMSWRARPAVSPAVSSTGLATPPPRRRGVVRDGGAGGAGGSGGGGDGGEADFVHADSLAAAVSLDNPLKGVTGSRIVCEACGTPAPVLRALGIEALVADPGSAAAAPLRSAWLLESFTMLSLSVPTASGRVSLDALLRRHFGDEAISGYTCDNPVCSHIAVERRGTGAWAVAANNARKQSGMARMPPVLALHIKRNEFNYGSAYSTGKTATHVDFPWHLDMRPHSLEARASRGGTGVGAGAGAASSVSSSSSSLHSSYELMAVVEHLGGAFGGHYVTSRRVPAAMTDGDAVAAHWAFASDTEVTPCSPADVAVRQAYMLFYLRRDARTPPRLATATFALANATSDGLTFSLRDAMLTSTPLRYLRGVFEAVVAEGGVSGGSGTRGRRSPVDAGLLESAWLSLVRRMRGEGGAGASAGAAEAGAAELLASVLPALRTALAREPLALVWFPEA